MPCTQNCKGVARGTPRNSSKDDRAETKGTQDPRDTAGCRWAGTHRLVLHQLHLQACDLGPQRTDLLAGLVLVHHYLVLDVSSPIGIFKCVECLHEVPI